MPSPTPNKALVYPTHGGAVNSWDTDLDFDWNAIDAAFGGLTLLNVTGLSGVVALTSTQYTPPIIGISGTLTANVNYQLPANVGGLWVVNNSATGGFTVTFSSATGGGATVTLPQGQNTPIFCDSVNVSVQSTAPPNAAGSPTQIQFNAGGLLAGSPNLAFDGGSNLRVANGIFAGTTLSVGGNVLTPLNISANAQTVPVAVAFSATAMVLNCLLSNVFATTFTASVTTAPTISNPNDGQTINWKITQDATGGRTMTWPVSFKWSGGSVGVLSTAANAVDLLVATYFAATGNWYASLLKGFS